MVVYLASVVLLVGTELQHHMLLRVIVEKYLQQHHHVLFEFYWLVDLEQQYRVLGMLLRLYHRNTSSGDIVPVINTNPNPVTSRNHRYENITETTLRKLHYVKCSGGLTETCYDLCISSVCLLTRTYICTCSLWYY